MSLKEFASEFLNKNIKSDIDYTGMTDSTRPGTLSFLDNPKFADDLCKNANIIAVLVRSQHANFVPENIETILVENPKAAFFDLHNAYCKKYLKYKDNQIAVSVQIHPTAYIAPEGVILGENVIIGPHATILAGVEIGDNSTIGPNCVIGYEGFHVFTDLNGIKQIVFHDGMVKIGRHVDIRALVSIDKGLMGRDTIIEDECKIDDLVHIAHRAHIGTRTLLVGQSSVCGSVDIGKNVWIGPKAVIVNRVSIGDNSRVLIGSVVIANINNDTEVSGNFAVPHKNNLIKWMRNSK